MEGVQLRGVLRGLDHAQGRSLNAFPFGLGLVPNDVKPLHASRRPSSEFGANRNARAPPAPAPRRTRAFQFPVAAAGAGVPSRRPALPEPGPSLSRSTVLSAPSLKEAYMLTREKGKPATQRAQMGAAGTAGADADSAL